MAREPLVELMVPAFCSDEAEEPTMRRHIAQLAAGNGRGRGGHRVL
jgi:hypothetical protein